VLYRVPPVERRDLEERTLLPGVRTAATRGDAPIPSRSFPQLDRDPLRRLDYPPSIVRVELPKRVGRPDGRSQVNTGGVTMKRRILSVAVFAVVVVALVLVTTAEAKKPGGGIIGGCPRDIYCLDVWDPVICSDGIVYSNDCYAYRACATGCVPYGGDTM